MAHFAQTDVTEYFQGHPLPMALFNADRRLQRLNEAATTICPADLTAPSDLTPARFLAELRAKLGDNVVAQTTCPASESEAEVLPIVELDNGRILKPSLHKLNAGGFHLILAEEELPAPCLGDAERALSSQNESKKGRANEEKARELLNDAIESLEEGFSLWDDDFNFLMCNDKYMKIVARYRDTPIEVGEPADKLLRLGFRSGLYEIPGDVDEDTYVESYLAWARSHVGPIEAQTKDGATIIISSKKTDLGGVLITARDVTEERNADQKALKMLYDIVESLEEGAALWDEEMQFVMCNQKYRDFVFHNLPENTPKPGTPAIEVIGALFDTQTYDLPDEVTREAFVADWLEWVENFGEPTELALTDGRNMVVHCKRSSLGGYLITVEDNTAERKLEAQLESQREAAHQNEKLSALGELLAGVAHELNNPLSIVVGYSQMLQGQLPDPKQNQKVERINQAAERSARIVKTFLAMARQRPSTIEHCDLGEVIEVAIEVAGYGLRSSGAEIDFTWPENLPLVSVDRDQMAQVFSNLIVNAEHALAFSDREPKLAITGRHDRFAKEICVTISDNGQGMSADVAKRIFDPFFTTKEVGSGTGFGLSFCHRIVTTHQGRLSVASKEGEGSTFTVRLPVHHGAAQSISQSEHPQLALGRGERILVVDDEIDVAMLIAETLTNDGFEATTAHGPEDALLILATRQFDAIISDVKMPRMKGDQLMAAILEAHPSYSGRIGFVTGDSLTQAVDTFLSEEDVPFIEKPVSRHELLSLAASLSQPSEELP